MKLPFILILLKSTLEQLFYIFCFILILYLSIFISQFNTFGNIKIYLLHFSGKNYKGLKIVLKKTLIMNLDQFSEYLSYHYIDQQI